MKKIATVLFLLLPLIGIAKDKSSTKRTLTKMEVSLTSGTAITNDIGLLQDLYIGNANNISVLRNFNKMQVGIGVDLNLSYGDYTDFVPHVFVNRTIDLGKMYLYGGIMGGYANRHVDFDNNNHTGYALGVQSGIVYKIGKHFALNAEIGVRRLQLTDNNPSIFTQQFDIYQIAPLPEGYVLKYSEFLFPTRFGVRYRF